MSGRSPSLLATFGARAPALNSWPDLLQKFGKPSSGSDGSADRDFPTLSFYLDWAAKKRHLKVLLLRSFAFFKIEVGASEV